MLRFLLLACVAVFGLATTTVLADVTAVFHLDSHDALDEDTFAGPVYTSTLAAGQPYLLTISGTMSPWRASAWGDWTGTNATNVCAGQAERWPQTVSPNTTNGPVGVDPEYGFGWVFGSPTLCPEGIPLAEPPLHLTALQISLDGGNTWEHMEAIDHEYNAQHSYRYFVVVLGEPAAIGMRLFDFPTSDNYGVLTAVVEASDGGTLVIGNGRITEAGGLQAGIRFAATQRRNGPLGAFRYEDDTGRVVRADEFTGLLILESPSIAYVTGTASVNGDPGHSFLLIVEEGEGGRTVRLDIDGETVISGALETGVHKAKGR